MVRDPAVAAAGLIIRGDEPPCYRRPPDPFFALEQWSQHLLGELRKESNNMKIILNRSKRMGSPSPHRMRLLLAIVTVGLLLSWTFPFGVEAAEGDLDSAFGEGGKFIADTDRGSIGFAITLQPDGKIVVAGATKSKKKGYDFAVARMNSDGELDEAFSEVGQFDFFRGDDIAHAVALQQNGKIVAAGEVYNKANNSSDFGLLRVNSDGSLDTSFGPNGKVTTDFSGLADRVFAMAIRPDGKILVAGLTDTGVDFDFALARYNSNGSLDETFGTGGKVTTDFFNSSDICYSIALQPDGKIVAAGVMSGNFALARYNPDGSLDTDFAENGKINFDFFGHDDSAQAVALQDGKILVAGYAYNAGNTHSDFALARLNSDGLLDASFGVGGTATTDFFGDLDSVFGVAFQRDGRILAAGFATSGNGKDFALARLNSDGLLDATFGAGGKVTTDFSGGEDSAVALAITPNGRALAAGYTVGDPNTEFAMACYRAYFVTPEITGAEVIGKKLYVYGKDFDNGAELLMNGETQKKTFNDEVNPAAMLIAKKSGKKIARGETVTLQVRNRDGALSAPFNFTRPVQ
jgi:uncharacterized delta-60 repeat protein